MPFKDAEPMYRTQILNKYVVANINGIPRILEILSNRIYYQKSLENKIYFAANMNKESKDPKFGQFPNQNSLMHSKIQIRHWYLRIVC